MCATCGVQYPYGIDLDVCPTCVDERQYVGYDGQQWTTSAQVGDTHDNVFRQEARGLWGVGTAPKFAIGQRALIVPGEGGNLLWDCISLVDDATVDRINGLGGLSAIAISHPHYYSAMHEWSDAFGGIPIHVHEDDEEWVPVCDGPVRLWSGDSFEPLPGRTLLNPRIHFEGGAIVHWPGLDGRGALCTGDVIQVVADRRWVSFMYSYPNLIPEHPDTIRRTVSMLEPYEFDVVYGAWWGKVVDGDAKAAVADSADRYLEHLGLDLSP